MGCKVLLVDANLNTQRMVELTLTAEFLEVASTGDGSRAYRLALEEHPDIVIADWNVPGRNGYDLCKAFRDAPKLAHVPVILIFDSSAAVDKARLQASGVDDYIVKPFKSKDLVDKVHALLSAGETTRSAGARASAAGAQAAGPEKEGGPEKKTVKAKKKTDVLMDLTGRRPRPMEEEIEEPEAVPFESPPPRKPVRAAEPPRPPAAPAAKAPPPAASPAGEGPGFDLAGLLADDEASQRGEPPPEKPSLDLGVEQTVFMTRDDLANLTKGAKPAGQRTEPPQEESGFTMIMSSDERKAIRPEPRRAPPEPPTRPAPPAPEPPPVSDEEEEGFHTIIMSKDELDTARARAASPKAARPAPAGSGRPAAAAPGTLPKTDRLTIPRSPASRAPTEELEPGGQTRRVDLRDETSPFDRTVQVPPPPSRGARERARPAPAPAPSGDDPVIERIVSEAASATEEELEHAISRLDPGRAEAMRKVGGEIIHRLARQIVPEVAERLVKEEIEKLKRQVV